MKYIVYAFVSISVLLILFPNRIETKKRTKRFGFSSPIFERVFNRGPSESLASAFFQYDSNDIPEYLPPPVQNPTFYDYNDWDYESNSLENNEEHEEVEDYETYYLKPIYEEESLDPVNPKPVEDIYNGFNSLPQFNKLKDFNSNPIVESLDQDLNENQEDAVFILQNLMKNNKFKDMMKIGNVKMPDNTVISSYNFKSLPNYERGIFLVKEHGNDQQLFVSPIESFPTKEIEKDPLIDIRVLPVGTVTSFKSPAANTFKEVKADQNFLGVTDRKQIPQFNFKGLPNYEILTSFKSPVQNNFKEFVETKPISQPNSELILSGLPNSETLTSFKSPIEHSVAKPISQSNSQIVFKGLPNYETLTTFKSPIQNKFESSVQTKPISQSTIEIKPVSQFVFKGLPNYETLTSFNSPVQNNFNEFVSSVETKPIAQSNSHFTFKGLPNFHTLNFKSTADTQFKEFVSPLGTTPNSPVTQTNTHFDINNLPGHQSVNNFKSPVQNEFKETKPVNSHFVFKHLPNYETLTPFKPSVQNQFENTPKDDIKQPIDFKDLPNNVKTTFNSPPAHNFQEGTKDPVTHFNSFKPESSVVLKEDKKTSGVTEIKSTSQFNFKGLPNYETVTSFKSPILNSEQFVPQQESDHRPNVFKTVDLSVIPISNEQLHEQILPQAAGKKKVLVHVRRKNKKPNQESNFGRTPPDIFPEEKSITLPFIFQKDMNWNGGIQSVAELPLEEHSFFDGNSQIIIDSFGSKKNSF